MRDAKFFSNQAILRLDHVANGEMRERSPTLNLAIAGRGRQPIADRVRGNNEIFVGV